VRPGLGGGVGCVVGVGIGTGGLDAKAAMFWLFVCIPLAWGVYKTLESSVKIL